MRLETRRKAQGLIVDSIVYDDIYGVSEFFEPKIWIDFWSSERKFFLRTVLGEKISITRNELRRLNLKMIKSDNGGLGSAFCKYYMTVNSPRRAAERIPLLSISNKLNKIWRGCINVEREYESRREGWYGYWCP